MGLKTGIAPRVNGAPPPEIPLADIHLEALEFWELDDVFYASRHPHIFSSIPGITINDQNPEVAEYFGSMIVLDDPRHQRLRSIVSRAFTPKVVARIETSVRERAHRLVTSL